MKNFREHFGQEENGTYAFSNVRSGLIVGLVSYTNVARGSHCD